MSNKKNLIYSVLFFQIICTQCSYCSTYHVSVASTSFSQLTGIMLNEGDSVVISASGSWRWSSGPDECTADGISNSDPTICSTAIFASLVGSIGGGACFGIGAQSQFVADRSGELALGFNEVIPSLCGGDCYFDNSGSLSVTISVNEPQITTSTPIDTGWPQWATFTSVGVGAAAIGIVTGILCYKYGHNLRNMFAGHAITIDCKEIKNIGKPTSETLNQPPEYEPGEQTRQPPGYQPGEQSAAGSGCSAV